MSEDKNEASDLIKDPQPQIDPGEIHSRRVLLARMSKRGQRVSAAARKSR